MPPKRKAYHHGDLSRALVIEGARVLEQKGREGFTLREVAKTLGVTHASAYRHYEDKNALLAAIAEEGFRALAKVLDAAATDAGTAPRARVSAIADAYVSFALEKKGRYSVMFGARVNEDGRFATLEAAIADALAIVTREIERGQAKGVFCARKALDLAVSLWIMGHGFAELVHSRRLRVKSNAVAVDYFHDRFEPVLEGFGK